MKPFFVALALGITSVLAPVSGQAQDILRFHAPEPGGGSYIATVAIGRMAEKHENLRMQVQAGQTGTRSLVALAKGEVDFTLLPVSAVNFFRDGKAMYAQMADAPELYGNLRGILVWECCSWHYITYDESGIAQFDDFVDKQIYTGPPGSVAKRIIEAVIKSATGFEAGEDYTPVNLDWGAGAQALRDGNVDILIQPAQLGSAAVEELSTGRPIRLIGLPDLVDKPELAKTIAVPGNMVTEIPTGIYSGQINEAPVTTTAVRHIAGVGVHTDADTIYRITKAVWENIDEFYQFGSFLKAVNPELAFVDMNVPLHEGAYRYYVEQGWDIPDRLAPPEAR